MNRNSTGKITKMKNNENGTITLEIVTTPTFGNNSERILNFDLEYDMKANNFPFSVGDLVRFNENDMRDVVVIPSADFDYTELSAFVYEARYRDEVGIEGLHQTIIGLTLECDKTTVLADEMFMDMLLGYDFGMASPVEMPAEYIKFFNSEYVSNYYITRLKEKGIILDDSKALKDLTGEEWNNLYKILDDTLKRSKGQYLCRSFFPLAFQIDSEGARDFLNNYADPQKVIRRLMNTSGLNPSPSYYSGRGARLSDLNQNHLFSLYLKLEKLDEDKALAMAQLAYNIPTLGATEFINSLYKLAAHNYDLEASGYSRTNVSVNGAERDEVLGVLLMSYAGLLNNNPGYNDYITRQIKIDFIDLQNKYLVNRYLVDESDEHHLRLK